MSYNVQIKQAYDFTFHAASVLGLGYKGATVMAVMDYDSAKSIQDVTTLHAQVYPFLPSGTPRNPADLMYVKVKTTTDQIRVVAMDWISTAPVLVTTTTVLIRVTNTSVSDIAHLRNILIENNFKTFEITTLSADSVVA